MFYSRMFSEKEDKEYMGGKKMDDSYKNFLEDAYRDIIDTFSSNTPTRKISDVLEENPSIEKELKRYDPIKTAAFVSSLLTLPALHANNMRIEMLIHLIMAYSQGTKEPTQRQVLQWLNIDLGKTSFVSLEDPVEDVFVSNVFNNMKNIRIFEGLWENNGFYLQKVLSSLEIFPEESHTQKLKAEVRALLLLSEEIAARRKLDRYVKGGGRDKEEIKLFSSGVMKSLSFVNQFTLDDLQRLKISKEDLEPFILNLKLRNEIKEQSLDDSILQTKPIVQSENTWIVILPNVIGLAVRIHILNSIIKGNLQSDFDKNFLIEYQKFFSETPIMGRYFPRYGISWRRIRNKHLMVLANEIDPGRYLQIIVIIDSVFGYQRNGFWALDHGELDQCSEEFDTQIQQAKTFFRKKIGFKQGMTLIIDGGYGRPVALRANKNAFDWKTEFISAPDLEIFSEMTEKSRFNLWKLIDFKNYLIKKGITFSNVNGLLNLYAWWIDTKYLLESTDVPIGRQPLKIMVPTDYIADLRIKIRQGFDVHLLPFVNGYWLKVKKKALDHYFADDYNKPFYACIDSIHDGVLLGAWVGEKAIWWLHAAQRESTASPNMVFKVWDAIHNWMERISPILENFIQDKNQLVNVILDFNQIKQEEIPFTSEDEIASCLHVSVRPRKRTIILQLSDPFLGLFQIPSNIAERAIIRAIIEGFFWLIHVKCTEELLDQLEDSIVPNNDVRYFHAFRAVYFHDYIQSYDPTEPIFVDEVDESFTKLGMGWLAQKDSVNNHFTTVEEITNFLNNNVIDSIWDRVQGKLHTLNRINLLEQILRYMEGVENQKLLWQRTIRALLALHDSQEVTMAVAVKELARCNASSLALRLVGEMAIAECPLDEGLLTGAIDLTALMSDVLYIFQLGGISNAIRKEVMEPEIKVAPNGNILSNINFYNNVITPLGKSYGVSGLNNEKNRYEKNYEDIQPVRTVKGAFPDAFLEAFQEEFGLSIDSLRGVRETLENMAISRSKCVYIATRDNIFAECSKNELTCKDDAQNFLERFSLWPRKAWNKTPKGFEKRDWYPWLFGRELSLVARPVIKLEEGDNPRYLIAPSLIIRGTTHTIRLYYEAEVPTSKCRSKKMKVWIEQEKARSSHEFVCNVASIMENLGYQVFIEIKVTELIQEKTPVDFGDVDVFAWKKEKNKYFAIECKDLKFSKTPNEIAEQMNHFSGENLQNGKRDELLKHIDRCNFLNEKSQKVAKKIGLGEDGIHIQNIVCFSKLNPTQYVKSRFSDVKFIILDQLLEIENL